MNSRLYWGPIVKMYYFKKTIALKGLDYANMNYLQSYFVQIVDVQNMNNDLYDIKSFYPLKSFRTKGYNTLLVYRASK